MKKSTFIIKAKPHCDPHCAKKFMDPDRIESNAVRRLTKTPIYTWEAGCSFEGRAEAACSQ
jgi:hypothetical protein